MYSIVEKQLSYKDFFQNQNIVPIMIFQERGVTLAEINRSNSSDGEKKADALLLTSLESSHPSGAKVFINDSGHLEWPVLFLYPEHGETDFISRFNEHAK